MGYGALYRSLHWIVSTDAISPLGKVNGCFDVKRIPALFSPTSSICSPNPHSVQSGCHPLLPFHCQPCPFHLPLLLQGLKEVAGTGAGMFVKDLHAPTSSNDIPACLSLTQEKDRGMAFLPCTEGGGFEPGFLITRVWKSPRRS